MGRTSIIGANFLDRFRSSDYKNSVYAIAEILDNSVDAEAKNIELITISENKKVKEIFLVWAFQTPLYLSAEIFL